MEVVLRAIVDRENIGLINAIIEAYEEVAITRVIDKKAGLIEFYTSIHYKEILLDILNSIKEEYGIMISLVSQQPEQ